MVAWGRGYLIKMDCPRCASNNGEGNEFCWMCGSDLTKDIQICDRCGLEAHEHKGCPICNADKYDPTDGWGDWNPADEDDE